MQDLRDREFVDTMYLVLLTVLGSQIRLVVNDVLRTAPHVSLYIHDSKACHKKGNAFI